MNKILLLATLLSSYSGLAQADCKVSVSTDYESSYLSKADFKKLSTYALQKIKAIEGIELVNPEVADYQLDLLFMEEYDYHDTNFWTAETTIYVNEVGAITGRKEFTADWFSMNSSKLVNPFKSSIRQALTDTDFSCEGFARMSEVEEIANFRN